MPRKTNTEADTPPNSGDLVKAIKYPAKRKNIPPAGLERSSYTKPVIGKSEELAGLLGA